jgi:hydrogenase maturation protease
MKTVVLGLGNSLRADDGVGLYVARAVKRLVDTPDVVVAESTASGLDVLDYLCGFDRAIVLDAVQTGEWTVGDIHCLPPLSAGRHTTNPHSTDLATALELGRRVGLPLPSDISLFGFEVADVESFAEQCTPEVAAAIDSCAKLVFQCAAAPAEKPSSADLRVSGTI